MSIAANFSVSSQHFYAFYLLSHGISGLPSFLYRTEHLNENWLCYQHFSEPFDQGP
jgi:uncharacterized membrane protein